ncbi:MAG: N-6 DNA methylase, partial [Cyclobacteriaceae bacterium]
IIAEYTAMKKADHIFEPSAGNGLLLIGADPKKVHANEIDKTRLENLRYQNFHTVTHRNATEPFSDELTKKFDVVITNPPFSKWVGTAKEKRNIITNYFHVGMNSTLARSLRLEHVMCSLALHTMKDSGRAALIIMGHIVFDHEGFISKYRPFFNWLYRNYLVDDIINLNSFKLYNKQGTIERTMLILIGGRKTEPSGYAPKKDDVPHLDSMVSTFGELWERVSDHILSQIDLLIKQMKIELANEII